MAMNDITSHRHVISAPIEEVVAQLVDFLGLTEVAVIGRVGETRAVSQWLNGNARKPQRPATLRFALQLALMIGTSHEKSMVRAWFSGSNPELGDSSPTALLRDRPLEETQGPLMDAARSFANR